MAKKNAGPKFPNLMLCVRFEGPSSDQYYRHINGWIWTVDGSSLYGFDDGGLYRGVEFRSQTDNGHLRTGCGDMLSPMYGYQLEWKGKDKGLNELRWGVRALEDIQKKLDKIESAAGAAASFGAWVQRICTAIGIDKVKFSDRDHPVDPQFAAYCIDNKVREWVQEAKDSAVPAC